MIPKIIHYCWFGSLEMPEDVKKIIDTWERYLVDYKFVLWNEESFDINSHSFVKEAYESKKYAFVSDYVRLYALYNYGGIYMDTDVEVLRPLDSFLHYKAFTGKESDNACVTGTMGAIKGHPWIKELLKYYDEKSFFDKDGQKTNTKIITSLTVEMYGEEVLYKKSFSGSDLEIFSYEILCAKDYKSGKVEATSETYTIHHFKGSWITDKERKKAFSKRIIINIFNKAIGSKKTEKLLLIWRKLK